MSHGNPADLPPAEAVSPGPAPGPTPDADRLLTLDVLRGFALLGILVMNIRVFADLGASYMNPLIHGPLSPLDHAVWWLTSVLADQKFMAIFSMLFGAGVVLMYQRRDADGLPSAKLHYRRMVGLLIVGLIHAYFIWFGDILVTYALCGMLLYPLRKLRAGWLFAMGVAALAFGALLMAFFGFAMTKMPAEELAELEAFMNPPPDVIAEEVEAYRGGFVSQLVFRAPVALETQTFFFLIWGLWRAGGVMLLGMALMKWGVPGGQASGKAYGTLIALGAVLGLPLIVLGMLAFPAESRDSMQSFFFGGLWNYVGSVFLAGGYVALLVLLCRKPGVWTKPLAAVGRMSLTNYLAQSVVCTLLFYGTVSPFPLFARLGYAEQMLVVVAVWALQLAWSPWWLKRYRMGPMEWLWRWWSYGTQPALRR
ncbi:MAG: DUF418 domain-containing protein [Planctomycetota bacterium]